MGAGFRVARVAFAEAKSALREVRERVFVQEQRVSPEEEWDGRDPEALHVLARDAGGAPIGTGRLLPEGRVGRMAVLAAWRGRGVGAALLGALLEGARERGVPEVRLAAQLPAIGFYARFGFVARGPVFLDANIEHREMVLALA